MVQCRDDIAMRGQIRSEPGVIQTIAAAPMRKHHQRMPDAIGDHRCIAIQLQFCEERHGERRSRAAAKHSRIEHRKRRMSSAVLRVDEFDLSQANLRTTHKPGTAAQREQHDDGPGEKDEAQPFVIDLDLEVEVGGDHIDDTADYRGVSERVRAIVQEGSFDLIETMAAEIAEACLVFPRSTGPRSSCTSRTRRRDSGSTASPRRSRAHRSRRP